MFCCFDMNCCDFYTTPTNSNLCALHSSNAGDNSRRQDRVPGQGGFAAGAARGAEDREQRRHDPALQSQVHELIKIRPPVGILKPGGSATVRLLLLTKEDLPEDDRQYVAVYNHDTEDSNTKARMQWDMVKKEQGIKRLYVRFERE
uniref:MSP domain-containing protein n=1 Tax=Meloidogyne incognita TaxID=6306 RepID=A0A914L8U7_MELIC